MKKFMLIIGIVISIFTASASESQTRLGVRGENNRWSIYAGGSLTHNCGGTFFKEFDGDSRFDWGGGAFIGGGYELNFKRHWSFNPSLEFEFIDNGVYYNKTGTPGYSFYGYCEENIWASYFAVKIPFTMGYRFYIANNVGFKVDAGFYINEAFGVSTYVGNPEMPKENLRKKKAHFTVGENFQTGFIGGISVETGNHFSYFLRTQYPFLKKRYTTNNLTLSLGLKYTF